MMYAVFIVLGVLAVYVIFAGWFYLTSSKVRCLFKTGHANNEALGSGLYESGPRFIYRCRDCGATWTEPWDE